MGDVITIGLDIAKSVFQVQKAGRPTLVYGDETPTRSRAEIESMAALPNIAQGQTVPAWGISGRSRFCHPTVSFSREQAPSARLCPLADATIRLLANNISWREYAVVYRASLSN